MVLALKCCQKQGACVTKVCALAKSLSFPCPIYMNLHFNVIRSRGYQDLMDPEVSLAWMGAMAQGEIQDFPERLVVLAQEAPS